MLVDMKEKKRDRSLTDNPPRRAYTVFYYLTVGEEMVQVCQKMFMNTFGVDPNLIHGWLKESDNGMLSSPTEKKKNF